MATTQGTGITGCSTYLKTILIPSLTTLRVTNIFDNELTDLAGYPSATITVNNLKGKMLDNARNERHYEFIIRIFIDRNKQNFGSSKAETILRTLADEFITKVDSDPTFGNNCVDSKPSDARFGYVNRQNQNIRMMEVTIDCVDVVTWR